MVRAARNALLRSLIVPLILLASLTVLLGLAPGPQTTSGEAQAAARQLPETLRLLENPTVETAAEYRPAADVWRVNLIEQSTLTIVAELVVDDDSGEVESVEISPAADTLEYPNLSAEDATKLAEANPEVREELQWHGEYSTSATYENGEWTVHFRAPGSGAAGGLAGDNGRMEVVRAGVNDESWELEYVWTGDQVGWRMARGDYGSYGKQANYWYVWGSLALAFALAFMRQDKLLSLRNLDVLALLSFLVSHHFFRQGDSYEAVLLWYPPLIYLLFRTLLMGFGIGERVEHTSRFPTWGLIAMGGAASGLILGLNLDSRVIDVGYAGVVGADLIMNGYSPYGHMPEDVGTGDTYGPLNYLLYVPFVMIFGFSGEWDFLPAAHALTILSFVVGTLALSYVGYRFSGMRGAAALFCAWATFPYTLYSTNNNTNDIVTAAILATGLAFATSPLGRGITVAAGFATKLFPLALGPLWISHGGRQKVQIIDFMLGVAGVITLSFWVLALNSDPITGARVFYEKTLAFQGGRETPWTIFAQLPQLAVLQRPLVTLAIALGLALAFIPRKRTIRRLAALSAAVIIAFQITGDYWFYPYITWFEPFVFLALLLETNTKTPLDGFQDGRNTASGIKTEESTAQTWDISIPPGIRRWEQSRRRSGS